MYIYYLNDVAGCFCLLDRLRSYTPGHGAGCFCVAGPERTAERRPPRTGWSGQQKPRRFITALITLRDSRSAGNRARRAAVASGAVWWYKCPPDIRSAVNGLRIEIRARRFFWAVEDQQKRTKKPPVVGGWFHVMPAACCRGVRRSFAQGSASVTIGASGFPPRTGQQRARTICRTGGACAMS